jgi:hypothetical protein
MMSTMERPWSVVVRLDEVGETARHIEIEADEETRAALAKPARVDAVERIAARFDVSRRGRDGLHVSGIVSGTVRQSCVVTLDPLVNDIEEAIEVDFAPPREADTSATEIELAAMELSDESEPLVGNAIDLGLLATEFLILGIDPYPRKPGAAFDAPTSVVDPAAHPFAALATLQKNSTVKK